MSPKKAFSLLLIIAMIAPLVLAIPSAQAQEEGDPNWVDINTLTPEIMADERFQFNPLGVKEIRYALNLLIDRSLIVDNIMEGSADAMLTALRPNHPAYDIIDVEAIEEEYGLFPAGDVDTAVQVYMDALKKLNETYSEYGMYLVFKKGEDDKEWLYFVKPDGTEQQVKIYFIIRIEDERKQIGEQIAAWIEEYFKIKVEKVEKERSVVTPIIYGTNPASYGFDTHPWHIYTEGWVSMTDDPPYYARYDAAFFYASLRGYGPNHRVTDWWYYYNPESYDLGLKLYFETYTPDMVDQLWEDIRKMLEIGIQDSIRAFITNNLEYFMVNSQDVDIPVYGKQTGLWSAWGLRTATAQDGTITALEFSSTGALFMSAWNPILGFNDVYSSLIWDQVHSFGMYPHFETGIPTETTASYSVTTDYNKDDEGNIVGNLQVPDNAIVFDPVENKWIPINQAVAEGKTYIPGVEDLANAGGKVPVKVVFNYAPIKWHYGEDFSIFDVLGSMAFSYEWAVDDSEITGEPDPYYDAEYATNAYQVLSLIKGIEVVNDTALAVYTDYIDVDPALIAYSVLMYASIPFDLLASMEKLVVEDMGDTNYGWTTREETGETGVDMLIHYNEIKTKAEELAANPEIYYFNGLEDLGINVNIDPAARFSKLVEWINSRGHAVVSNGPFYVEEYNPDANYFVLKSIENLGFDKISYIGVDMQVPNVDTIEFKTVTTQEAGIEAIKSGEADVFLWSMSRAKIGDIPDTVMLIPTSSTMYNLGFNPVSNVYDSNKEGTVPLKDKELPGQVIPGLVLFNPQQVLQEYATQTPTETPTETATPTPTPTETETTPTQETTPPQQTQTPTETQPPTPGTVTVTVTQTVTQTATQMQTVTQTATVTETVTVTTGGGNTALIAGVVIVIVIVAAAAALMRRQ